MIKIKVLKFGGTSLKDASSREKVIQIIKEEGVNHKLVIVVSAIGRYPFPYATDTLLSYTSHLSSKQKDQIASCGELISASILCNECIDNKLNATCLNVYETGIITTNAFENANIISINTNNIYNALKEYDVVIVPGFFGINKYHEITSIGRGGSDLSAIAISHYLGINETTIYTDVEGIYSCDPKKIKSSILYPYVNYNQAELLGELNVSVLMKKACTYARTNKIRIHLKSTFNKSGFTIVDHDFSNHKFLIEQEDCYILIDQFNDIFSFKKDLSLENAHYLFVE